MVNLVLYAEITTYYILSLVNASNIFIVGRGSTFYFFAALNVGMCFNENNLSVLNDYNKNF